MTPDPHSPEPKFIVVLNGEEQYSIWPEGREIPAGWQAANCRGPKDVCLAYITGVWTDMRPLSLRRQVAAARPTGA
jgi:MbtH protein